MNNLLIKRATKGQPVKVHIGRQWKIGTITSWDKTRITYAPLDGSPANDVLRENAYKPSEEEFKKEQSRISSIPKKRNAKGRVTKDCGDHTAASLRGLTLTEVYRIAAKALREDEDSLKKQYRHLNNGQQRMCLGNRIRHI